MEDSAAPTLPTKQDGASWELVYSDKQKLSKATSAAYVFIGSQKFKVVAKVQSKARGPQVSCCSACRCEVVLSLHYPCQGAPQHMSYHSQDRTGRIMRFITASRLASDGLPSMPHAQLQTTACGPLPVASSTAASDCSLRPNSMQQVSAQRPQHLITGSGQRATQPTP